MGCTKSLFWPLDLHKRTWISWAYSFSFLSFRSLSSRLNVFPEGLLGTASMNTISSSNHFYRVFWSFTKSDMAFLSLFSGIDAVLVFNRCMYARGNSPALSTGTPMTPQSLVAGFFSEHSSSPAGMAWFPFEDVCTKRKETAIHRGSDGSGRSTPRPFG